MNSAAKITVTWRSYKRGLVSLVNDNHVDNNLKEIFIYVYFGSIVNNRSQNIPSYMRPTQSDQGLPCPQIPRRHILFSGSDPCEHVFITKTYLYITDPLKPHFYIVKLGFIGANIIFLISVQEHRLWVFDRTASSRRF